MTIAEGPHTLIVDDEDSIRHLVRAVSRRENLDIETASDGEEALQHLQSSNDDLVQLKERLPEMLRNTIVMTATRDVTALEQLSLCGVIRKPFDLADIMNMVNECYRRRELLNRPPQVCRTP